MPNVTWKDFHPHVIPNVQGCPLSIVNNAIRNAVIEFCEKSLLWKLESEHTDVLAGQNRYTFSAPADAKVSQTVFASIENRPLIMTSLDDLDALHPGWRELESERPLWYYMDTDDSIRLVGIPSVDIPKGLEVHVALKPTRDSVGCPEFILENWAETIAHGALYRLNSMMGKPWASVDMVAYHRGLFREGLSRAKSKSLRSRQGTPKTIIPRAFGDF